MAGGSSSFLYDMTKGNRGPSKVLDSLAGLAGKTRPTSVPPPQPNTDSNIETVDSLGAGVVSQPVPNQPVDANQISQGLPNENGLSPETISPFPSLGSLRLGAQLPAVTPGIVTDDDFYNRTGRRPTQGDRLLLESRARLFQSLGREPRPDELFYEAQRNTLSQPDGMVL